jgi:hypothetical protein
LTVVSLAISRPIPIVMIGILLLIKILVSPEIEKYAAMIERVIPNSITA